MSVITRENIANQTALLSVTVEKNDYLEKFNKDLNQYSKSVSLKGFRKGNAPISVVKKMYGKQILLDNINKIIQKDLYQYIAENKIELLGQPIPTDETSLDSIDLGNLSNFDFQYEVGLAPEFEVKGLDGDLNVRYFDVQVEEKIIADEIASIQKKYGENTTPNTIEANDLVTFHVTELENGQPKEGGIDKNTMFEINNIKNESLKKSIVGLSSGDTFTGDIFQMEDKEPEAIKSYVLGVQKEDEVSNEFSFRVEGIKRVQKAALDQALFDKLFPDGSVTSEEALKAKIKENIANYYVGYTDQIFFKDVKEALINANSMTLPVEFLKKWLKISNENMTLEQIESDFDSFEGELKWSLLRTKIAKSNDVKVDEKDIVESFKDQIRGYFGGNADEQMVEATAMRLIQDEEQVEKQYQTILSTRVINVIKSKVTLDRKTVSMEELAELLKN